MVRLSVRIDFEGGNSIGPGKIRLLELVDELGSIRGAATAMSMSYPQAWKLLHAVNEAFHSSVIITTKGGSDGGRTTLTEFGRILVKKYRDIERKAEGAAEFSFGSTMQVSSRKRVLETSR